MKKYIIGLIAIVVLFSSCEKKVEPIDDFQVQVEYKTGPKNLTSDVTLNPKDSIYLDFTITSPTDMSYIEIQKNGNTRLDTFRLNSTNNRSFSLRKGYRVDSAAGDYSYRVLARDERGIFMGDGGKMFTVTITPDFKFWSYRVLQVPDTTNKTNKCYYSTTDGKIYSYSEGAPVSGTIDFGYYWDTTGVGTTGTASDDLFHTIYALNAPQPQLGYYDISTWTKNATVFKKMPTSVNFTSGLTSSGAINTLIKGNMTSGTSTKVTGLSLTNTGSTSNSVIGFRTASGKYGCIQIRYFDGNSAAKSTSIQVDVKVQM